MQKIKALFALLVLASMLNQGILPMPRLSADEDDWRTYEVYQPTIERCFVVNGRTSELHYNHCSSIAWFRDRWFCVWNGNQIPREGAPDQAVYMSTSRDGRAWSRAEVAFSSEKWSENPVPYPKGRQWQPNLAVVEDELWATWSQSGGPAEQQGCYVSRLADPDGKWVNRRLLWNDSPKPVIGGKAYRVFPSQDPYRLRSGRVLMPATIMGERASDAPKSAISWWAVEKRNTVLYSDDLGKTWNVSPGCIQSDYSWANWEPTVWEQSDGTVLMFARNNIQREIQRGLEHGAPKSSEYLLSSVSHDGGATWAPHGYAPIETVCSRMHVVPLDGRGVWSPARTGDDFKGRLYLMAHNDAPGAKLGWGPARRNLSLFFKRGDGLEFVAGIGLTEFEPLVCYPHLWVHGGSLLMSYSEDSDPHRSIKVAHVSPLPDPKKHYLLPRSNDLAPSPCPRREGSAYVFGGHQHIATRSPVESDGQAFSLGAWVRPEGRGAILDTRGGGKGRAGFLYMLAAREDAVPEGEGFMHPVLCLLTEPHVFGPKLGVASGQWQYIGVTVNNRTGEAVFYVNEKSETVRFKAPAPGPLTGGTGCIGFKSMERSGVSGFVGGIRALTVYACEFGAEQHRWLYNQFAEDLGLTKTSASAAAPTMEPLLRFNPADREDFDRQFTIPPDERRGGAWSDVVDGRPVLRIRDEGSAGVDLDENHRDRGDKVALRFRFRIEEGDGHTLCTVGDANRPARLIARAGKLLLRAEDAETMCGEINTEGWTEVEVETWGDTTRARTAGGSFVSVRHHPEGTWVYLGEGYPTYEQKDKRSFLVDVGSVRARKNLDSGESQRDL